MLLSQIGLAGRLKHFLELADYCQEGWRLEGYDLVHAMHVCGWRAPQDSRPSLILIVLRYGSVALRASLELDNELETPDPYRE
jgi:hypothetical protein